MSPSLHFPIVRTWTQQFVLQSSFLFAGNITLSQTWNNLSRIFKMLPAATTSTTVNITIPFLNAANRLPVYTNNFHVSSTDIGKKYQNVNECQEKRANHTMQEKHIRSATRARRVTHVWWCVPLKPSRLAWPCAVSSQRTAWHLCNTKHDDTNRFSSVLKQEVQGTCHSWLPQGCILLFCIIMGICALSFFL